MFTPDPEDDKYRPDTRRVEEELLVTRRLKDLAISLCDPLTKKYKMCIFKEGFWKTKFGLSCVEEKRKMEECLLAVSDDKEIYADCRRTYIEAREDHLNVLQEWKTTKQQRNEELWAGYRQDVAREESATAAAKTAKSSKT